MKHYVLWHQTGDQWFLFSDEHGQFEFANIEECKAVVAFIYANYDCDEVRYALNVEPLT